MAIRQEKYTIYIRPYMKLRAGSSDIKLYVKKDAYMLNPLATSSTCTHIKVNAGEQNGCWLRIYESNSLEKIRVKYKELLDTMGREYIRVEKYVPMDILVTPIS